MNRVPELASFLRAVAYGDRLHGVHLFGSRAHGDHRRDSDYDVAVVLDDAILWREQDAIADIAFETLMQGEVLIQPVVLTAGDWLSGEDARPLVRAIRRDGIELHHPE